MSKALLVIDLQNDYFPGGKFPLWNTEAILANVETAIKLASPEGIPVVHIQHIADPEQGWSNSRGTYNEVVETTRHAPPNLDKTPTPALHLELPLTQQFGRCKRTDCSVQRTSDNSGCHSPCHLEKPS